jgi:hypothetical protein
MQRLLVWISLALWPAGLAAQGVLVAPHAVFVDHRTRSGWIQLYNPTTEPSEVSVEALFGFPVSDSAGRLELRTIEQPDSTWPSAVKWLSAFPKRALVPPQGRQVIRLLMTPPADLPDGEYWARLAITARAGAAPVTGADSTQGITVGLNLEVRTIIPLLYRKGAPTTGVSLSNLRAQVEGDSIVVRGRLVRSGKAAFLGTVRGTLTAADGSVAGRFEQFISVYYDLDPRFSLPRNGIKPGRYRLSMEVVSERTDIASEQILQAQAARETIELYLR